MPKFRSKQKIIDAEQLVDKAKPPRGIRVDNGGNLYVETIQGQQVNVKVGEWIVDEGDGVHFYPIADDIFKGPKGYDPL